MPVTTDDLSAPLGQGRTVRRGRVLTIALPHAIAGVLSIFIAIFAGWAMIVKDPFGGEPMAVVHTDLGEVKVAKPSADKDVSPSNTAANERPGGADGPVIVSARPSVPAVNTITIIDGTSGNRQEIVIPMPVEPADDQTGTVDDADASPARPLPKVVTDGSRQSDAKMRPVKAVTGKPSTPRR
jgi:uncharacterized protein